MLNVDPVQMRQDLINAINLLILHKQLDAETNYQIEDGLDGRPKRVAFWIENPKDRHAPLGGVAWVNAVDLIVGAGRLSYVRGKTDSQ